jgi:hypothetical protein
VGYVEAAFDEANVPWLFRGCRVREPKEAAICPRREEPPAAVTDFRSPRTNLEL